MKILLMSLISIHCAAKWHNMNNRGCKPTVISNLNVTALKGLNISLVKWIHYSTPLGLPEGFLCLQWVAPTVIQIKPLRGKHINSNQIALLFCLLSIIWKRIFQLNASSVSLKQKYTGSKRSYLTRIIFFADTYLPPAVIPWMVIR